MRLCALLCVVVTLAWTQWAFALGEARIIPPDWPDDTTYEFAIKDRAGQRIATAYYRILWEETGGRPVYRFKYVGRNEQMSEASECWAYRDTMLPLRSTRKVVSSGRTFFQDVAYSDGVVIIRRKYEGEDVVENELPAGGGFFDYEELIWLIPQLDFGGDNQVRFNIFATLTETPATIIVTDRGMQSLVIQNHEYQAHCYSFDVNMTPYVFFTVEQDGRWVPAHIDMGANSFVNMNLDPAKAGGSTAEAAPQPPLAPPPAGPEPVEEEEPGDEQEPEEEEPPSDPHVNPLGPPPSGSRF